MCPQNHAPSHILRAIGSGLVSVMNNHRIELVRKVLPKAVRACLGRKNMCVPKTAVGQQMILHSTAAVERK